MSSRSLAAMFAALSIVVPATVLADCSTATSGAGCVSVPARPEGIVEVAMTTGLSAPVSVGQVLERGQYSILMNAEYYGLPDVSDGWVYMRIGRDVFRVNWHSQQVLERVTDQTAANF